MKKTFIQLAVLALIATACSESKLFPEAETGAGKMNNGAIATFRQPIPEWTMTKVLDWNLNFSFEPNGQIDVYPNASGECMVYSLTPAAGSSATFEVENFNLKDGTYGAVYPADKPVFDPTQIAFSLAGQNQVANDDASHLSVYDLNFARTGITGNTGEFNFDHKVAWLKVTLTAAHSRRIERITVSADEGVANSLTLDSTSGEVTAAAKSSSEKLVLTLNGGKGIDVAAGSTLMAYMTIPAGDYTNLTVDCADLSRTISGLKAREAGHAYVIDVEDIPVYALSGKFTVNSEGKKVYFSKGNLWYGKVGGATEATFNFEANQYDYQTSWNPSHVNLFYWSKTASVAYAEEYSDSDLSVNDVLFTNETRESAKSDFTVNGVTGKYRTLSNDEWIYLFNHHSNKFATVHGVMGYVIAPDGFSGTIAESYADDAALAKDNLLFLPCAGDRNGNWVSGYDQGYGSYISSSIESDSKSRALSIRRKFAAFAHQGQKSYSTT